MVRIFFLPYLGNRSKSDPRSYELFCLESHILSFPKVLQIPPESPCMLQYHNCCGMTPGTDTCWSASSKTEPNAILYTPNTTWITLGLTPGTCDKNRQLPWICYIHQQPAYASLALCDTSSVPWLKNIHFSCCVTFNEFRHLYICASALVHCNRRYRVQISDIPLKHFHKLPKSLYSNPKAVGLR